MAVMTTLVFAPKQFFELSNYLEFLPTPPIDTSTDGPRIYLFEVLLQLHDTVNSFDDPELSNILAC